MLSRWRVSVWELALVVGPCFLVYVPCLIRVHGCSRSLRWQIDALSSGVHVVVGTPGRVTDLIDKGVLSLGNVTFATLDEADDMLRVG